MKTSLTFTLIATAVLLSSTHSLAAVTVVTDTESLQQRNDKQYFSQDGLSGEEANLVPGAGAGMPLKAAAGIIVPPNWKVMGSGEFERALVSWKGNLTWPQILRDIAQREKIYISLDWVKKVASINVPNSHSNLAQPKSENPGLADIANTKVPASRSKAADNGNTEPKRKTAEIIVAEVPSQVKYDAKNITKPVKKTAAQETAALAKKAQDRNASERAIAANKSSLTYIKDLENERAALIAKNNANIKNLESKEQQLSAIKEKYSVVDNTKTLAPNIDAVKLQQIYRERTVLPFNPSFDYFVKGGHADRFSPDTPATYVAKPGTVEDVITAWSNTVGYGVEYRAGVQHQNDYQIEIKGSFIEATIEFIKAFEQSDRPLNVEFYPDVRVSETKKGLVIISDLKRN